MGIQVTLHGSKNLFELTPCFSIKQITKFTDRLSEFHIYFFLFKQITIDISDSYLFLSSILKYDREANKTCPKLDFPNSLYFMCMDTHTCAYTY